jgi:acyl-coenzyme A thioesterase PaaI-like protein
MAPRMTVAELDAFLRSELPWMFNNGSFVIECADGQTCRIRQRFHESMLRPGGIVSGAALMTLADVAMYVVVLSAIGPVAMAVTTNLNINFLRVGSGFDGLRTVDEARQAARGRRNQPVVGGIAGFNRSCDSDLFHSKQMSFLMVLCHLNLKHLFLLD